MAKNQRYTHGKHIALTATEAVESGGPVKIGQVVGVAQTKAATGEKVTIWLDGSYDLTVTGSLTEGQAVHITPFKSAPTLSLGATATTGGTFAAGTYFWKATALDANGETVGSNEVTATIAANGTQVLNWGAIGGATGYKIYRGTAAGGQDVLVATLGAVTTYTDTGTAGVAATVPTANTTGGNILTATKTGNYPFGFAVTAKGTGTGIAEVAPFGKITQTTVS